MAIIGDERRHVKVEVHLDRSAFAFPGAHEPAQDVHDAVGLEIQVADFVADVG